MSLRTLGENLVGRVLRQEKHGGVPHYVTGQHRAEIVETEGGRTMMLSYVDNGGHAVLVALSQEQGEWIPQMVARAGHQVFDGFKDPAQLDFRLSDKMIAAIQEAEHSHENRT